MTSAPESPSHEQRAVAEGFGDEADRYERTRPTYPDALFDRAAEAAPGRNVLDVGCGTGISARPLGKRGFRVLGLEPDARMADVARRHGVDVEASRLEDWDPTGRTFDLVTAGQSWHWVDPVAGAARVESVLRPGGLFVAFWNAMQTPPQLTDAFGKVYARLMPDTPLASFYREDRPTVELYDAGLTRTDEGLRETGGFGGSDHWRFDWRRDYTRDEWLDMVPTLGGHSQLPPDTLEALLTEIGGAVDAIGGRFTMDYATVATAARRVGQD